MASRYLQENTQTLISLYQIGKHGHRGGRHSKEAILEARKVNIINTLQLISSVSQQDQYDRDVPIANVSSELINQWFDDSFFPEKEWIRELFTDNEWKILMEFHDFYDIRVDKLPNNYAELKKNFHWKEIVGKANWALDMLKWRDLEAKYDDD